MGKSNGSQKWIREKLDRAFATEAWLQHFPLCKLFVSHTITSDHDPIHLELMNVAFLKKQFCFKFENTRLKEKVFHADVTKFWENLPRVHLIPKLYSISSFMVKCRRQFFHKFREKVQNRKEIISGLVNRVNDAYVKRYFAQKEKLHQ